MAYATIDDFNKFGPNSKCWPADFDTALKEAFIESAAAEIDSYIGVAYALPLSSPYDNSLIVANVSIAVYRLLQKRGWNPANEADAVLVDNYTRTLEWLNKVATGRCLLKNKKDSTANLINKPMVV